MVKISPPPPEDISTINPIFFNLSSGSRILRIHKNSYDAIDFNPKDSNGRFDHHLAGDTGRSVYYAAPIITTRYNAFSCCIAECFGETRTIQGMRLRNLGLVRITRNLKILDLQKKNAMRAGLPAAISGTTDRSLSQAWSRYFYESEGLYSRIDGIIYPGAYIHEPAILLYERSKGALTCIEDLPLNDSRLRPEIQAIAKDLGIVISPNEWS